MDASGQVEVVKTSGDVVVQEIIVYRGGNAYTANAYTARVVYVHDEARQVGCWVVQNDGIYCMPDTLYSTPLIKRWP
jgi:hypothetical protein